MNPSLPVKFLMVSIMCASALLGFAITAHANPIKTDIVMVVDESGSMGDVQTNLRNNIGTFASILAAGGVDAQFGLVGYGSSTVVPRMLTNLTTSTNFATAAQGLLTNGGTEPGYTAIAYALNALDNQSQLFSFRPDALTNVILFTDEPSNGDTISRGSVGGSAVTLSIDDQLLTNDNALFNAALRNIIPSLNTIASYQPLATNHGGSVYDLNGLNTTNQTVVENFVNTFATSKLQEIVDFCTLHPNDPACQGTAPVPAPPSFTLLILGLGLLLSIRRYMVA